MKVIILRGIPGSGKSTIADNIANAVICSADNYFMDRQGNYNFDPKQLGEAHKACMRDFLRYLNYSPREDETLDHIIVDNTNVELWEISPYVAICQALNVEYEITTIECDPKVAAKRNIHGVPERTINRMADRIDHITIPRHWNHKFI